MVKINLKITKSYSSEESTGVVVDYLVTKAEGMTPNIFLLSTYNSSSCGIFSNNGVRFHHVAYVDELSSVSDKPSGKSGDIYRASSCVRGYHSEERALKSIEVMKKEVDRLVREVIYVESSDKVFVEAYESKGEFNTTIEEFTFDGEEVEIV